MGHFEEKTLLASHSNCDGVFNKIFPPAQISAINSPVFKRQLELSKLTCQDLILPWQPSIPESPYSRDSREPELLENDWKEFQNLFQDINDDRFSRIPKPDLVLRWQRVFELLLILRKHYPNCEVHPFGSLLTGLGDVSSDIDIWVDVNGDRGKPIQKNPLEKKVVIRILENVMKIIQQCQCPHNDKKPFAKNAKSLGTRVSYMKFIHNPSQIECDLPFGNRLAL